MVRSAEAEGADRCWNLYIKKMQALIHLVIVNLDAFFLMLP